MPLRLVLTSKAMLSRVVTSTVILATLASGCGESSPAAPSTGPTGDAASSADTLVMDRNGSLGDTGGALAEANMPEGSSSKLPDAGGNDRDSASNPEGGIAAPPALKWTQEGPMYLFLGIWGSSPNDVYAVEAGGLIMRSTGDGTWTGQVSGTGERLTGVWGSGPNDIYISVRSNVVLHSTGNGVWDHHVFQSGVTFSGVWGSGPNDVYVFEAGADHTKGDGTWSPQIIEPDGQPTLAMWGSSATDVYAGAALGTVYHSVGNGIWIPQKQKLGVGTSSEIAGIAGSGPTDIYAITYKQIFHSNGDGAWKIQNLTLATLESLTCVWALDKSAIYIGSSSNLYRSGGDGVWLGQPIDPKHPSMSIYAVWGTSVNNLYVATTLGIYHGTP